MTAAAIGSPALPADVPVTDNVRSLKGETSLSKGDARKTSSFDLFPEPCSRKLDSRD